MRRQFLGQWFAGRCRWWAAVFPTMIAGLVLFACQFPDIPTWAKSAFVATIMQAKGSPDKHVEDESDQTNHRHAEVEGHEDADDHAHTAIYDHLHDEAAAITLSKQARGNIGLSLAPVELRPFERTITVPGIVVERPGWSVLEVTAPTTGLVTRIYPIQGEAVQPGQPLFEVRLTHEDLLQTQAEFLRAVEELDVVQRELSRLEKVAAEGAIAGKTLLDRRYAQQKQEAALRVQRQALLLHGVSAEQVDRIVATRTLLQSLTIHAPAREADGLAGSHPLQVRQLNVVQGKHVNAGDSLCTLVDDAELYIEGRAFEQDIPAINRAVSAGRRVAAVLGSKSTDDEETVNALRILYLDNQVDGESRAFHFYVTLPNRLLREDKTPDGRRFVYWQFKSGQRTQIRVPVEQWEDRIVLSVDAVAQDGAEAYVFEANDDHFDRRPVHVDYRDQDWVVIANDGALKVGAMVAVSAAHQMQLAMKNKAGGGIDPHAGHNH